MKPGPFHPIDSHMYHAMGPHLCTTPGPRTWIVCRAGEHPRCVCILNAKMHSLRQTHQTTPRKEGNRD